MMQSAPDGRQPPSQGKRWLLVSLLAHLALVLLLVKLPSPDQAPTKPALEVVWLEPPHAQPTSMPTPQPTPPPSAATTPAPGLEPHPRADVPELAPPLPQQPEKAAVRPLERPSTAASDPSPQPTARPESGATVQLYPPGPLGSGLAAPLPQPYSPGNTPSTPPGSLYLPDRLLTVAEVKARIQAEAQLLMARDRADRGLVSRETLEIGSRMEAGWKLTPEELHRWPVRPSTRTEHWLPPGLEDAAGGAAMPCTYQRYSLAEVEIELDRYGTVVARKVVRTSGNRGWDNLALELVDNANPFPAPGDLGKATTSRSRWDIGARDYSLSSCRFFGGALVIKDIVLVGAG